VHFKDTPAGKEKQYQHRLKIGEVTGSEVNERSTQNMIEDYSQYLSREGSPIY
jgi:hypothetical protein